MSIKIKTDREIQIMHEGGQKLARIKKILKEKIIIGENAKTIDDLAEKLILKEGGKPSFKMVKDYHWTTCINKNEGVVHGIPSKDVIFLGGDLISLDIGMYYKGYHTDSSFSLALVPDKKVEMILQAGKEALVKSIDVVRTGNYIWDISKIMETTLGKYKMNPVHALVGHGVGMELHEDPAIPCFTKGIREKSIKITQGMVLAIEVMYSPGSAEIKLENDGWTISTQDGKISALFEETVAVTKNGPMVLTA